MPKVPPSLGWLLHLCMRIPLLSHVCTNYETVYMGSVTYRPWYTIKVANGTHRYYDLWWAAKLNLVYLHGLTIQSGRISVVRLRRARSVYSRCSFIIVLGASIPSTSYSFQTRYMARPSVVLRNPTTVIRRSPCLGVSVCVVTPVTSLWNKINPSTVSLLRCREFVSLNQKSARELKQEMRSRVTWLCDCMSTNSLLFDISG